MTERSSEGLIRELVGQLAPVRPIPRLRRAAIGVAGLWLLMGALILAMRDLRPDLLNVIGTGAAFVSILGGLGLVGLGGIVTALAVSVPGREGAARLGLALGLGGVLLSAGVGTFLVVREAGPEPLVCPFENDLACFAVSCLLALPPALAVLTFVSRGSPFRPLIAVLCAASGAVALGAMLVHLTCPELSPRHIILSHVLAPVGGALLLTYPFHLALRKVTTR